MSPLTPPDSRNRQLGTYSPRWFSTFLGEIDASIVTHEVAFLERHLPLGEFPQLLDLCCGPARHAAALSQRGYGVIGIDRDAGALSAAIALSPGAFVRADMTALPIASESLDGVVCMWQSFGYLDDERNRNVLAGIARALRSGGRLVLDVYHRDFHAVPSRRREILRRGLQIVEDSTFSAGRLRVHLRYATPDAAEDVFEWKLYRPEELETMGQSVGLQLTLACTHFDETVPASAEHARMQLVFRRSP